MPLSSNNMGTEKKKSNNSDLMRYAGMGTQIFVSLGIAVFVGIKADKALNLSLPLLTLLLPVLVLCLMIFKLVKETSKKNNDVKQK